MQVSENKQWEKKNKKKQQKSEMWNQGLNTHGALYYIALNLYPKLKQTK